MPSLTVEADLPVSAPRIWRALKDGPTLIPKLAPEAVYSMEHVSGKEEEVGAVRLIKLGSAAPAGAYLKEKLVVLDHDAFTVVTEEVEGGHLSRGFTKWVSTWKFIPVSDTSSKLEGKVEYECENEAAVPQAKQGLGKVFVDLATYLNKTGEYA